MWVIGVVLLLLAVWSGSAGYWLMVDQEPDTAMTLFAVSAVCVVIGLLLL